MKITRSNIYLIGMMGTGKTAVGKLMAEKLQMEFLDSDHLIEEFAGRKISEIFATEGESKFREMEREFITSGHPTHGCIVSCGGGLATIEGIMDRMKSMGTIICLWANPTIIYQRIKDDQNRPLLQVKDPLSEIEKIVAGREQIYMSADLVVNTDKLSLEKTVETVISELESMAAN